MQLFHALSRYLLKLYYAPCLISSIVVFQPRDIYLIFRVALVVIVQTGNSSNVCQQ